MLDSNCLNKLVVVVCEKKDVLDTNCKCLSSKEEAEDVLMSLWVFFLFVTRVGEGGCID